ncbi:MAG: hypothetical protein R3270_08755 [Gammaproteobacteria bacterium]|nr:hypothetical protein [Gammaproteobacteria bacterium]
MNSRWNILLAALVLAMVPAHAAEEDDGANQETRTEGDVLVVEEIEGERTRSPKREADFPVPERGMDMDKVRDRFGEPVKTHPAVGDPPITRWDYDGYRVYFEYDKVLHTVVTE